MEAFIINLHVMENYNETSGNGNRQNDQMDPQRANRNQFRNEQENQSQSNEGSFQQEGQNDQRSNRGQDQNSQ